MVSASNMTWIGTVLQYRVWINFLHPVANSRFIDMSRADLKYEYQDHESDVSTSAKPSLVARAVPSKCTRPPLPLINGCAS